MALQKNTTIPTDWDVDVIDYWNASLKSYTKHHEDISKPVDPIAVTNEFLDSLPVRQTQNDEILGETEPVIAIAETVINKAPVKSVQEVDLCEIESVIEESELIEEYIKEHTKVWKEKEKTNKAPVKNRVQETQESQIGQWENVSEVKEKEALAYTEEQPESYAEYDREQEAMDEPSTKRAKYQHTPPEPPTTLPQDNEAFSNLIMSWYYAGYYTGLYQAKRQ